MPPANEYLCAMHNLHICTEQLCVDDEARGATEARPIRKAGSKGKRGPLDRPNIAGISLWHFNCWWKSLKGSGGTSKHILSIDTVV